MAPGRFKAVLRRFKRRPPFALVLVVVAAAIAGAFVLVGSSGTAGHDTPVPAPKLIGAGPNRVCTTAHAQATDTASGTIRLQVSASAPVSATGRATVGRASATVRLTQRVVERATVARPVSVRRRVVVARRACARAGSAQAARGVALTTAYRAALPVARAQAKQQAARDLVQLEARVRPQTLASAQRTVNARAHAAAAAAQPALAQRAAAAARAKALAQSHK